jgi:putative transposase
MNNHYHLLISPVGDDLNNVSLFMKKLNMGYAKFFNEKYERSGYLWQGKYKKILVSNESYFQYIPYYVHLNPLDYTDYNWRKGGVMAGSLERVKYQLENFRWSSFLDYSGKKNFPSILYTKLLSETLHSKAHQTVEISRIISGNNSSHFEHSGQLEK